jgi:hypothetical protein
MYTNSVHLHAFLKRKRSVSFKLRQLWCRRNIPLFQMNIRWVGTFIRLDAVICIFDSSVVWTISYPVFHVGWLHFQIFLLLRCSLHTVIIDEVKDNVNFYCTMNGT